MIEKMRTLLEDRLQPSYLEILDESEQHLGHQEYGSGHYLVKISSPQFQGKNRVECHRLVFSVLGQFIGQGIHALRIEIITPNQIQN